MSEPFFAIGSLRDVTLPPLSDDWIDGLTSCGSFTIKGFWLGHYDHVEHDRRKARRLARRSGVKFTTRPGFGKRVYWFDFGKRS